MMSEGAPEDLVRELTQQLAAINARLDQMQAEKGPEKAPRSSPADPKKWPKAVLRVFENRPDQWLATREVVEIIARAGKPEITPGRATCSRYLSRLAHDGVLIRNDAAQQGARYRLAPKTDQ